MLHYNTIQESMRHLLAALFQDEKLKDFTLLGGTALSLLINHRKSVDIDLTTVFTGTEWESTEKLLEYLSSQYRLKKYYKTGNFLTGEINKIKTDFVLSPKTARVKKPTIVDDLRMASIEDISAMKMRALLDRYAKKDAFDIAALSSHFTLNEMLSFFKKRYPNYLDANLVLNLSNISQLATDKLSGEITLVNNQSINQRQVAILLQRIAEMDSPPKQKTYSVRT